MNFLSLIESKRDGHPFTPEQIRWFVSQYTVGNIPDYQMAAMLMAIYFRGLNPTETRELTLSMRDSGDVLRFPGDPRPLVDKHSTGGVGDKVSLPLAPLLACLGFRVPMISGRGLGITGGTLDKLESIPGFKTTLSTADIIKQVQTIGCVICSQTENMVPADRLLYSLRDVTGTVPSIPLIVASILSKKLSEHLDALILDVKFGAAAFMQTEEQARELARSMVSLGNDCGVNTRAFLSDMNAPLGRAAGNWLEVKESVDCLEGKISGDLTELVIDCAAHLLVQTKVAENIQTARGRARACLESGAPRKKWDEMLLAQGADIDAFHAKLAKNNPVIVIRELKADRSGYVASCNARIVGEIVRDLGGGRLTKHDHINHNVGIDCLAKPGEATNAGATLARVHATTSELADRALTRLRDAFTFSDERMLEPQLISECYNPTVVHRS